jgi:hypothetical protein
MGLKDSIKLLENFAKLKYVGKIAINQNYINEEI